MGRLKLKWGTLIEEIDGPRFNSKHFWERSHLHFQTMGPFWKLVLRRFPTRKFGEPDTQNIPHFQNSALLPLFPKCVHSNAVVHNAPRNNNRKNSQLKERHKRRHGQIRGVSIVGWKRIFPFAPANAVLFFLFVFRLRRRYVGYPLVGLR